MTVSGEKAPTVLPKPWPDSLPIGLGQLQPAQLLTREELEPTFAMIGWQIRELGFDFKQEHKPMALSLVTMLTHHAGKVQIGARELKVQFFKRFAAGTGVRGFTRSRVQFTTTWTPKTQVWFLGTLE